MLAKHNNLLLIVFVDIYTFEEKRMTGKLSLTQMQTAVESDILGDAKTSLTRLLTETSSLPPSTTLRQYLVRIERAQDMRLLSYVIVELDHYLKVLAKAFGTSYLHTKISPDYIRKIEHLAYFACEKNLNSVNWKTAYSFSPNTNN